MKNNTKRAKNLALGRCFTAQLLLSVHSWSNGLDCVHILYNSVHLETLDFLLCCRRQPPTPTPSPAPLPSVVAPRLPSSSSAAPATDGAPPPRLQHPRPYPNRTMGKGRTMVADVGPVKPRSQGGGGAAPRSVELQPRSADPRRRAPSRIEADLTTFPLAPTAPFPAMDGWLAPDPATAGWDPAIADLDPAAWPGEVPGLLELLLAAMHHSSHEWADAALVPCPALRMTSAVALWQAWVHAPASVRRERKGGQAAGERSESHPRQQTSILAHKCPRRSK